jgi:Fe2+ or Zn2+ uptake regulation protein
MQPFYNTIQLTGEDLKKAVSDAQRQEDAIYLLYKHTGKPYSPSQVLRLMEKAGKNWPITSIRRAITNLEQQGKLDKTYLMFSGPMGKPEHTWIIKN